MNDLENQLGALGRSSPDEAILIPALLSEANALLEQTKARGAILQAEEVRLNSIKLQFERKAAVFMRVVGHARLEAARPAEVAAGEWWWYIDRVVSDQQRAQRTRVLRIVGIVAAVLVVLGVIYQVFLAPDPSVVERLNRMNNADLFADQGQYVDAIEQIRLAQTAVPDDPVTLIMEAAYREQLGEAQAADELFSQAKNLSGNEAEFLLNRAQVYLRLGQGEAALEDVNTVITRDPESALGYYLKASTELSLNQLDAAYYSFQRTVELAEEQGNIQLSGTARVQMAYLTQQMMMGMPDPPTATP